MSSIDQCPSTKGKIEIPESPAELAKLSGRPVWRSAEEFSGDPSFKDFVEREFPGGASLLEESSRRSFMKVMGASLALAGAATLPACRRPDRKILTYSRDVPEEKIPGKAMYYATALALPGGGAEGLLAETHMGRPTKIEGNPQHPNNRGKSSAFAQACVLDLYDPDRLKFPVFDNPTRGKLAATWDDFKYWARDHFDAMDADRGERLAFIADKQTSPTRDRMRDEILARWPRARWIAWNPAEKRGGVEGTRLAFGAPHRVRYRFDRAARVLSINSDFTGEGPDQLYHARTFASTRKVRHANDEMSRLYMFESMPTGTGSMADHRFRLSPGRMPLLIAAIARELGMDVQAGPVPGIEAEHIRAIAEDLRSNRGRSVLVPDESLPGAAFAMAMAINAHLGAMDEIVELFPMDEESASDPVAGLTGLVGEMNAGRVGTVVVLGANPVYDAPGSLGFADAFARVPMRITLSVGQSETASASTWSLNGAHTLEAWGDVVSTDGTLSVVQPMIAPLFEPAMSQIELLAQLLSRNGAANPDGYALVTRTWARRDGVDVDSERFKSGWRRALHDGLMSGSTARPAQGRLRQAEVVRAFGELRPTPAPGNEAMEVEFYTVRFNDGRSANNAWLQELPEIASTVVWDNPIYLSPHTARGMGLLPEHTRLDEFNPYIKQQMPQARMATLSLGGRSIDVPVWILPGMADHVIGIKLGYGRTVCGLVGDGAGFNTYDIKPADMTAMGARLERTGSTYTIASTQNHWSLAPRSEGTAKEQRDTIVRAMDKKWWDKHGSRPFNLPDRIYGTDISRLNAAEMIGELDHTPPNISAYDNPFNRSPADPDKTDLRPNRALLGRKEPPAYARGPQWGMSIDMNACTGCAVCTVACQAENNIPVVGKSEVAKGREMTWIRVDRYFVGENLNEPDEMLMQPIACVHCENAPCEVVCPVNATIHGPEGTNNMAYNRCIGTRYCANNCPYKVRRFNFFDYAVTKFRGGLDPKYVTQGVAGAFDGTIGQDRTFNQNFIPPRLRKKLDEIQKMQYNPNVTVRSRGVMEKCSYCIQRVNAARQEVKVKGLWTDPDQTGPIPDGYFQAACQQACPTGAISFGDILDPHSQVSKDRESGRTYMLLGYLNTRPRTTHMMKVRNPNEAIRVYDAYDPIKKGGDHGAEASAFVDSEKRLADQGYTMSLRVLGTGV
ncbi:MAG: TAT-variant-translocated molybdopterin oxidoreductase [Planctomycetes bacterium]|nr:TAT-variant-translocated molybdopterin oxidoreductase [Planctomycetota bacterium]